MKPIQDLALIKLIEREKTTESGIILPTNVAEPEYEVLEVGDKCKGLEKGDVIRLYEHADKTPYDDFYFIRERFGIKVIL